MSSAGAIIAQARRIELGAPAQRRIGNVEAHVDDDGAVVGVALQDAGGERWHRQVALGRREPLLTGCGRLLLGLR